MIRITYMTLDNIRCYAYMMLYGGYMPIITFSVPQDIYETIQSNALSSESQNLAAKRLLLSSLGIDSPGVIPSDLADRLSALEENLSIKDRQTSPVPPDIGDRLDALELRLDSASQITAYNRNFVDETNDSFSDIADRLTNLEKQLTHVTEQVEARFALCVQEGDRLSNLENRIDIVENRPIKQFEILQRLDKIETAIAQKSPAPAPQPDTAIMIQKKLLELAPTPTEITLTHEEAAHEFERAARTVKGWANDPNKWPQGWIWDGDRQFWIKEV